jgi:hypothetical protein
LQNATGYRYAIFAKIRVADFCVGLDRFKTPGPFERVAKNHVDFVICDASTFAPLVAIELDDPSHLRADRRAKDATKDGVFAALHLPLIRVRASEYATYEVGLAAVANALASGK